MALIKCPECGKEVSDKAEACIRCGYPINKNNEVNENLQEELINPNIINVEGKDIDIIQVINLVRQKEKIKAIKLLREMSNLSLTDAKDIIDKIDKGSMIQNNKSSELTCPYCGSTQIQAFKKGFGLGKAITGGTLLGGAGLLGGFIGSNKIMITCLKCGKQWESEK